MNQYKYRGGSGDTRLDVDGEDAMRTRRGCVHTRLRHRTVRVACGLNKGMCKDSQHGGTMKGNLSAAILNRFLTLGSVVGLTRNRTVRVACGSNSGKVQLR